jgi:hypothetical protein
MSYIIGTAATVLCMAGLSCFSPALAADGIAPREQERIEYLIDRVGDMNAAVFIRNGREYDAGIAARFLRSKWKANADTVKTAEDFVEKVASRSSTTGTPYRIRMKDGTEIDCGEYLGKLLASQVPVRVPRDR